jgi:WD40 repeat protein
VPDLAGDQDPVLRLEGKGPLSPVEAVAFGPGGTSLYEAGWDKVIRVWRRDRRTSPFTLDPTSTLRVPIGPGDAGVLNALAVSADGAWLAVGGNAVLPEGAGFRQAGLILPRENVADPLAQGVIHVFDLRANPPQCRQLRGHRGPIWALVFATLPEGRQPVLLSAGSEPRPGASSGRLLKLRVWDIATRKELHQADGGEYQDFRPWLAAWSVAPDHDRIRAAVAWTNSSSLIWDVGLAPPRSLADPHKGRSTVLNYLPDKRMLLTGHFVIPPEPPGGYLDAWDETAHAAPLRSIVVSWAAGRPIPPDVKGMPIAQAVISSQFEGKKDLAAVVLQSMSPSDNSKSEYRLQLLDITDARFGTVRAQTTLWTGPKVKPFVASAPGGDCLAIVGNPANEILVYSVADLLQDRLSVQKLRGVGEPIDSAIFVRKGADDWGLRLRLSSEGGPDEQVFDFMNRRFSSSKEGWTPAQSAPDGWQTLLTLAKPERPGVPSHLWIYHNQQPLGPGIKVFPESNSPRLESVQVTALELLPPTRLTIPIAAIATIEPMVGPRLALYNGSTGERIRQLDGHTGRILSLAFSQDGRYLVSAADDRTASVWNLTDLDSVVQQRGALPGLVLTKSEGHYVVARLQSGSPYMPEDVRAGDIIDGYVEGQDRLVELGSALDIHYTAAARKPGQTLSLRRRRDGQGAQDVALLLGQLIDERKPLMTFFVVRQGPGKPLDWLAWNPFGPYDASGPGVASLFGWHFNALDRPEEPARFALASSYPKFRREGLALDLIRNGRLPPPPPPVPVEPPDMQMFLDPDGQPHGELLLVRQPPTWLFLQLDNRVAPDQIESVKWRFDQGPPRPMRADDRSWTADLSEITWDRETHEFTVEVRTREPAARSFPKHLKVRYLPRPPRIHPRISLGIDGNGLEVVERRFRFVADIEPAKNEKARVYLTCRHADVVFRQVDFGPDFAARPSIDELLELKPGSNTIELEAVNQDARDDLRGQETERFGPLTIRYHPRPVEPPIIKIESLLLLPEKEGGSSGTIKVKGVTPCIVETTPHVRVLGRITAKDKLKRVEWRSGEENWKTLSGLTVGLKDSFDIREELELIPNRQIISFRAQAANDESLEATQLQTLIIEYHPKLPDLRELEAQPPGPIVKFGTEGGELAPVSLTAHLVSVGLAGQLEVAPERVGRAAVVLNGEQLPGELIINRKTGTISGSVRLPRGKNQIQIQLSNPWHTMPFGPIVVEYRCPPQVEQWETRLLEGRPFARVSARVASLTALSRAEIEVAPRPQNPPNAQTYPAHRELGAKGVWTVFAEVPLTQGVNEVTLRTWNEDGASPEKSERLVYEKPVQPKPDLIMESSENAVVGRPIVALHFRVRSASSLTSVNLFRERSPASRKLVEEFNVGRLARSLDGAFEFPGKSEISLEPGQNSFAIVTANAGGETSKNLVYTYTPPPLRVVIDGVEPQGKGARFTPRGRAEGPAFIPEPLPDSAIVLHGRVIWTDSGSLSAFKPPRIQIWVNGFPQVAVRSGDPVAGQLLERPFQAEILLSQSENNEIGLRLDGAPLDILGDRKLLVSCRQVQANWGLHLLVIGVDTVDWKELRTRAIESLKGRDFDESTRTFKTPAFPTAQLYNDNSSDIHRRWMTRKLGDISKAIRLSERPSNEVVILYYQGKEVVEGEDPCLTLRTRIDKSDDDDFIRLSEIRETLNGTRGAKLFLLDVTHTPDKPLPILEQAAQWLNDDSPFGILRFSTRGPTAPPDVSLVAALREAIHEKVTLSEVSAEVDRKSVLLRSRFPTLRYLPEFTHYFNGLVLGGP